MGFHRRPGDLREWLEQELGRLHERLDSLDERLRKMATSLDGLKAADTDLQNEVATFLQDVLNQLNGDNPDIDAVAADIETEVAALKSNDPATPAAPPAAS